MITKRIGRTLLFYFSCLNFEFWRGRIMKLVQFYICFVESWLVLFIFKEYRKCVKAFTTLCEIYRLNVKSFSAKQHQMKNTDFFIKFYRFFCELLDFIWYWEHDTLFCRSLKRFLKVWKSSKSQQRFFFWRLCFTKIHWKPFPLTEKPQNYLKSLHR